MSGSIQEIAYDNSCVCLWFCINTPTATANLFSVNSLRPDLAIQGLISVLLLFYSGSRPKIATVGLILNLCNILKRPKTWKIMQDVKILKYWNVFLDDIRQSRKVTLAKYDLTDSFQKGSLCQAIMKNK